MVYAMLPIRLLIGAIFLYHGYPKAKNFQNTVQMVTGLGFKPAAVWAFALTFAELGGAIAILAGFATKIFTTLLFLSMLVATYYKIFVWKKTWAEYELDLLILACLIALFLGGAGSLSIDGVLGWTLG